MKQRSVQRATRLKLVNEASKRGFSIPTNFKDIEIYMSETEEKTGGWERKVFNKVTIEKLFDTFDLENSTDMAETTQILRILRSYHYLLRFVLEDGVDTDPQTSEEDKADANPKLRWMELRHLLALVRVWQDAGGARFDRIVQAFIASVPLPRFSSNLIKESAVNSSLFKLYDNGYVALADKFELIVTNKGEECLHLNKNIEV